ADLVLEYQSAVLSPAQIGTLAEGLLCGASALPRSLAHALGALDMGDATAQIRLQAWSEGPRMAGDLHWLPDVIRHHDPDGIAVEDQTCQMTYRQLDDLSDALAGGLSQHGIGPGDLVGICMTRKCDLLASLLAVWKRGAAYVPLDPSHPAERLRYLLSDSGVSLVIVDKALDPSVLPATCQSLFVQDLHAPPMPSLSSPGPEGRAYIMYTSGSTGLPKGVEITHGALANYLAHAAQAYCREVTAAIVSSAFTFDATLTTLLAPLLSGVRIEMLAQDGAEVPTLAGRLLTATGPLLLKLTPTHLWAIRDYLEGPVPDFRHCIVVGGEAFSTDLARHYQTLLPSARLINEYGPTETVVGCTIHEFDGQDCAHHVPIGRPIRNVTLKLLDEAGQEVPPGRPAELLIGGAGVGVGYHGRPALTAERFITLSDGRRYYRSGDLACWSEQGQLLYHGRKDDQLKVRGHRIEPAEVEGPLRLVPGVTQAAVALVTGPAGSVDFVGYVGCTPALYDEARLKALLRSSLPDHLIPDRILAIDALPLTPNGKLDRAALPAPEAARRAPAGPPAASVLQKLLVRIADVIGYDIDPDMNFLESGLNSLTLMKLHAQLVNREGFDFQLVDFFTYPTPRALAQHVTGQQTEAVPGVDHPDQITGEDIAIIGMAVNVSGAADLGQFYETITRGQTNFVPVGPERADPGHRGHVAVASTIEGLFDFDPDYFGLSLADAELMDPQQRLILMGAVHALENAGLAPAAELAQPIGVFVSSSENQYQQALLRSGAGPVDGFQMSLLNEKDFVSTRIAYHLNLTGPALTVQSACSSSLAAIHVACQHLRLGECGIALAGGVSADPRLTEGYEYRPGRIFSHDGSCRAFGAESNGTVPANGMGLVVLKPLSRARAEGDRIYAVIRGSAINNDGHAKVGFTAPSVSGQAAAICRALEAAKAAPSDIGYIEAHGTGTHLGDPVEFEALCQAFGAQDAGGSATALGSVKSQLGHTASAAGVIGLIRAALGIYGRVLPATFGAEMPNPHLPLDNSPFHLNTRPKFWAADCRLAGVSSFGMGGTNAHLILGNAPEETAAPVNRPAFLPFSARTATALRSNVEKALALLSGGEVSLAALATAQRAGKSHYPRRIGFECASIEDAIAQLSAYLADGSCGQGLSDPCQKWLAHGGTAPQGPKALLPLDSLPYAFDRRPLRLSLAPAQAPTCQRSVTECLYQSEWARMMRLPKLDARESPLVLVNAPARL
ncbi:MAG: amino acid adenylation domain-containing protein, partial [Rhodobacteraceae bacterium]|nr:amino acid adenylation domain-containing protein [Paracoccaceae bacterium]